MPAALLIPAGAQPAFAFPACAAQRSKVFL